jgi:hypothetical protein
MSQNINLYDSAFRIRRDWLSAKVAAVGVTVVVLTIAVSASVLSWQLGELGRQVRLGDEQSQSQQTAVQESARQMAAARPDGRLLSDLSAAQGALEQRRSALQLLNGGGLGSTTGYSPTLEAFARQSLTGLWLTGVTLNHRDMAIRGRALDPELVPTYLLRLNHEPALQGRSFRALEIQRPVEAAKPSAGTPALTTAAATPAVPQPMTYVEFALASAEGIAAPGGPGEDKR